MKPSVVRAHLGSADVRIIIALGLAVSQLGPAAPGPARLQRGYSLQSVDIVGCNIEGHAKPYSSPDSKKNLVVGPTADGDPKIEVLLEGARVRVPYSTWPCPQALWTPDSRAFFLNYSTGGAVGTFETRLFYPSREGVKVIDPTKAVVADFLAHYPKCFSPETPNVAGIAWLSASRLLVAAQVLPHSNCDAMGTFATYEIEVPSGTVRAKHSQLESKKLFPHLLGPELQNANDECFTSPASCRIPELHKVGTVPYNNALQLTRGASEASGLRRTRHRLVPLAAERECWADSRST